MLTVAAVLVGVVVGALAAAIVLLTVSHSRVRAAKLTRTTILSDAEREAEAVRREAQVAAREQAAQDRASVGRRLVAQRAQAAAYGAPRAAPVAARARRRVAEREDAQDALPGPRLAPQTRALN